MTHAAKELLFLSLEDVLACDGLDMKQAANDVGRGFELLVRQNILQPCKTTLKAKSKGREEESGLVNCLPAYVDFGDEDVYGCKILGAMPANTNKGLPRATGLLVLFEGESKTPVCVMDAQLISAVRTGAVSLLAAEKICNRSTHEIGLIGAGVNMRTQLLGLKEALPSLQRARVYSRGESKYLFAEEMSEKTGLEIKAVETAEEAVRDVPIVVTCLANVTTPVVKASWVGNKGVTVFNIGCYESESVLLKRMDRVIADKWEQAKHRGVQTHARAVFENIIPEEKVEDLAPILTGTVPGRQDEKENIFFAPTGMGFEDCVVGWRIYKTATARGIGSRLALWKSSKWI